jgi:hypothetical protein
MEQRPLQRSATVALLGLALVGPAAKARAGGDPDGFAFFEAKVRPVLVDRCYRCHSPGPGAPKGGLRLDTREGLRLGGDSGPAVVPGEPDSSLIIRAVEHAEGFPSMPPKGKLPDAVVADMRRWVAMGAPDPRGGPSGASKPGALADTRASWSLRPIVRPDVPTSKERGATWARTPIDAFILAGLRGAGLEPAPEADRRTLIRRLSFDLTGLPPSPAEVEAFVDDPSPDAYERLVDRLLASPHHGERWARHWMDAVHFAETHGHDQDRIRPNAWPYRDYLIESFNRDTPYARFAQEQLAADVLFPDEPRLAVALGFIASGPWDESSLRDIRDDTIDRQVGHYLDRDDMVTTAMATFTSTTAHCARCHDHKFDPITQEDYYALQAVFAGVDRADRAFDTDPAVDRRRRELTAERETLRAQLVPLSACLAGPEVSALAEFLAPLDARLAALPAPRYVYAGASEYAPDGSHKPPGGPRPVHVLKRGDILSPGPAAVPGALSCVAWLPGRFELPDPSDEGARRAALARWVTDPSNPLTWRSVVNRVWQHHFGRGIVDTPNDFGRMGSQPSHPELLDWLAAEFRDGGGSLKRLHRLIVTSAVYRQSSRHDPRAATVDADNRRLWRQNRRRLDAESVRDAVLSASGRLDRTMGGPSVRQFALSPGVHVTPVVDYSKYTWDGPGAGRRGVYRFLFRTLPDPFMDGLDAADPSQLTPARGESVTALQALVLLHDRFILRHAEHFARRLEASHGGVDDRIRAAFWLALGRTPSGDELRDWSEYTARHGQVNACRVLFNCNEFLFID